MGASAQPDGEVVVLGESRPWPAIAIPAATTVAMIIVWFVFQFVSWYAVTLLVASIVLALTRWRNAVLADETGLLLRDRGGLRRSYAWSEIERIGWVDLGMWGSALAVYPRGGPYDVPGPNSPTRVGRIWRPRRRRLPDPLPALLEAHGIKTLVDY